MVLYGYESSGRGLLLPEWRSGRWWYNCDPLTAASNIAITLEESVGSNIGCTAMVAGVSTPITMTRAGTAPYFHFTGTLPIGTTSFGFILSVPNSVDTHTVWRSSIQWFRPSVPDSQYLHFFNSEIAPTVQDAADSFVCAGMSLWTQYTGSDLVNGGEIAGYRYPAYNITPLASLENSYTRVSSTPGALVGQLKYGAYGFYLPQTQRELNYRPLEDFEDFGSIVVVGRKASADSTLRINFNQFLIVSTTNQAFSKNYVPADPSALSLALSMLKTAGPVIENDGHQEKIKKMLAWIKRYEPQIKKGAISAARVAKLAAPVMGALLL